MIRPIKQATIDNVSITAYTKNYSAQNKQELSEVVKSSCLLLNQILDAAHCSPISHRTSIWACIDKHHEESASETFSSSSIHVTTFCRADGIGLTRCYFVINLTLFNPKMFDLLRQGRRDYQRWLVHEVLSQWQKNAGTNTQLDAHAWIYGDPSELFGYDDGGRVMLTDKVLPEPEDHFVDLRLVLKSNFTQF